MAARVGLNARRSAGVGRQGMRHRSAAFMAAAGGVQEHVIVVAGLEATQHSLQLIGGDLGNLGRFRVAILGPVGHGALPVHLEDAHVMAGFLGGDGDGDAQRALAAASLLRHKRYDFHERFPWLVGDRSRIR